MGNWYNGFSPNERDKKFKEYKLRLKNGTISPPTGPCALCGDPDVPVEHHSEDYGQPYIWEPPGLFELCRHCHRHKLHKRFADVALWHAYLTHVRRGGYARDLKDKSIMEEVAQCKRAIQQGKAFCLRPLRPYTKRIGHEWFAQLTMDPASLCDPSTDECS